MFYDAINKYLICTNFDKETELEFNDFTVFILIIIKIYYIFFLLQLRIWPREQTTEKISTFDTFHSTIYIISKSSNCEFKVPFTKITVQTEIPISISTMRQIQMEINLDRMICFAFELLIMGLDNFNGYSNRHILWSVL